MAPDKQPNSMGTGWTVTDQQETTDLGPDGRATIGVRVNFKTTKGITGSVFVPRAMYSVANVQAAISDYVAQLHAVAGLSG